jgi:hypothetical protein
MITEIIVDITVNDDKNLIFSNWDPNPYPSNVGSTI